LPCRILVKQGLIFRLATCVRTVDRAGPTAATGSDGDKITVGYGAVVVVPVTLFDIDPDDTATPLVPPLVWLTLMPVELVVVPLVVILPLA
jgi:hypothetical protein